MMAWARRHGGAIYLTCLVLAGTGASYYLAIHNAASVTQLCQAGNEARAQQIGLWNYLIHLSGPPKTAEGRAVLARFEQHLRVVFRPRNCGALGH